MFYQNQLIYKTLNFIQLLFLNCVIVNPNLFLNNDKFNHFIYEIKILSCHLDFNYLLLIICNLKE